MRGEKKLRNSTGIAEKLGQIIISSLQSKGDNLERMRLNYPISFIHLVAIKCLRGQVTLNVVYRESL